MSRPTHHRRATAVLRACILSMLMMIGALPRPAGAQLGATTDIITGTVVGPDGVPLAGVQLLVTSVETGITRTKTTNDRGQYTLLFPDGGGQYQVVTRFIGMAAQEMMLARIADEDRLVANFTLSPAPTRLSTVTTRAPLPRPRAGENERPTPGSTGRTLSGEQLTRLPIDPSDPNAIALLAPGVTGIEESDSTPGGFSVAGQRPDQNQITLDGLTFEDGSVPQEAVRTTRVVTSTYDVARGQFTGGLVQSTTRGGTNDLAGSFSYSLRDPRLQWSDESEDVTAFQQGYTQHQLSGGFGGPVIENRLFYYGSLQLRRRTNPLQSLLGADDVTLGRLGAHPDSVARFLDLLPSYGLPASIAGVPDDQSNDNLSGVLRVDYQVNENHSVMVRGNIQGSLRAGSRTGALVVPSYGGEESGSGGGIMASLSSVMGQFLNEGRVFYSTASRSGDPYLVLPAGRVRVSSEGTGGGISASTLGFGGNPGLPSVGANTQMELTNELSLLGIGGHRYKLGGLLNYTSFSAASTNNQYGTFAFNSLEDFAANTPASFTRTLTTRERDGAAVNSAIYIGDTWRKSRAIQLTYGLRFEHSVFLDRPEYNPQVEQLFGRRTDKLPSDFRISPRAGFTWILGAATAGAGQPGAAGRGGRGGRGRAGSGTPGPSGGAGPIVIRGGVGEFRGRTPTQLFASAIDATGLPSGEQQIVCIGNAVPMPDWQAYLLDPGSIPGQCADGGTGAPVAERRPNVTVFDPDFASPRAWRASLGVSRRLSQRFSVNADVTYALGTSLYGTRDLNLRPEPVFTLASENGRPVYVPASSIVPRTGVTSVLASRQHPQLAQVVEANSLLNSRTAQISLGINGIASRGFLWNASYTFARSIDQTSFAPGGSGGWGGRGGFGFGTGSGTTGGDPNSVEWGTSDLERRHSVRGSLNWFARPWLDVTSIFRLTSGQPFTPRVGGDINGDGSRNDRAFVFDPADAPDEAIADGITRLLESAPGPVRECIAEQLGQIAGRNSCASGWTPGVDLQLNLRPDLGGRLGRRLTMMVSFINPLAGADRILHGSRGLRGWGQPNRPDATLLSVRGFDPVEARYIYEVNERFGDSRGARTALRNPFQLGIQARLQVGPDRQRQRLLGGLAALGRRGGAGALDARAMVERVAPDPVFPILELRDSIGLSVEQVAALEAIGDSLSVTLDSVIASVQATMDSATAAGGSLTTLFPRIQPRLQAVREQYLGALREAERVLTPEQWRRLPRDLRNPTPMRRQGQREGGRPPS